MQRINAASKTKLLEKIVLFAPMIILVAGSILLILLVVDEIREKALIPLLVVGGVLKIFGLILCICIVGCVGRASSRRCNEVLLAESRNYSAKYGIPVIWKKETYLTQGVKHTVVRSIVSVNN